MSRLGEPDTSGLLGALIGLLFGFFAHRSRFCAGGVLGALRTALIFGG